MKGKYRITVKNRRVTYTLDIERNITVIRGDSATGKTSLIQSLAAYESLKEKSGVSVSCDRACHVFRTEDWEDELRKWSGSIVFADEGNAFISSKAFASAIRESDNYYVLITRESLFQLPYSVNAVLELRKTTSRFKHTYNRTYPYYHFLPETENRLRSVQTVLTEDSNSGYEWFSFLAGRYGLECVSAKGKTAIFPMLAKTKNRKTLVFADGAAFGAEMERVYQYTLLHPDEILLYLPESFEWIVLKTGIIETEESRHMLDKPYDYIESKEFFSWERFFTEYLTKETRDTLYHYTKSSLNPIFKQGRVVEQMLRVIEEG